MQGASCCHGMVLSCYLLFGSVFYLIVNVFNLVSFNKDTFIQEHAFFLWFTFVVHLSI